MSSATRLHSSSSDPHLLQGHVTAEKSPLPVASECQPVSPVAGCGGFHTARNLFSRVQVSRQDAVFLRYFSPFIDKNFDWLYFMIHECFHLFSFV